MATIYRHKHDDNSHYIVTVRTDIVIIEVCTRLGDRIQGFRYGLEEWFNLVEDGTYVIASDVPGAVASRLFVPVPNGPYLGIYGDLAFPGRYYVVMSNKVDANLISVAMYTADGRKQNSEVYSLAEWEDSLFFRLDEVPVQLLEALS